MLLFFIIFAELKNYEKLFVQQKELNYYENGNKKLLANY